MEILSGYGNAPKVNKKPFMTLVVSAVLSLGLVLLSSSPVFAVTEQFTASGFWICPAGVTSVTVEAWGGGGGGGGPSTTTNGEEGGGGGGGEYRKDTVSVTEGNTYNYQVGVGGTAGVTGTKGGDTIFDTTTPAVIAIGGGGGGAGPSGAGGTGGTGGTGALANFNGGDGGTGAGGNAGAGGGGAGTTGAGGNGGTGATVGAAGTGDGTAGAGGAGGAGNNAVGVIGNNYGGGGGGGVGRNGTGAAGAGGYLRLTYTAANSPPAVPTNPTQYQSDGTTVIGVGGYATSTTVVFEGDLSDPDGDTVKLQIDYTGDNVSDCESTLVPSGSINAQVTCAGLTDGTGYDWQYRAVDGNSAASVWTAFDAAATDFTVDATAPTDGTLTATSGDSLVDLSWTAATDATSGVALYDLRFDTAGAVAGCVSGTSLYSGALTTFSHIGLTNGTTYYYRVCATDNAGNLSAGATASATPSAGNTAPNVPTNPAQYESDGTTAVNVGGYSTTTTLVFEADLSDPDGDTVKLQIDYTGDNASDCESALVASGSTNVQVTCTGLTDGNGYDWQYRSEDSNAANSVWTAFNVATPDFTVDATAPSVSSTVPTNSATGVALNSNVTINFSENIECTTVNTTNITSDSPGWTFSSCSAAQAIFTTSGQTNTTTYNVNVTTSITDQAGNALSAAYPFSYTTVAVGNTPPTDITLSPNQVADGTDTTGGFAMTLAAVDPDAGETFTFSKTGAGADQAKFTITGSTLTLTDGVISYNTPGDANADRIYEVEVQVVDSAANTYAETLQVTIIPAYNPMIHSSLSTGSTKWSAEGGWGIAGGKYGEFTCATCHARKTGNIKRVKTAIAAPNGTDQFPIEADLSPPAAISFLDSRDSSSDFGDDVNRGGDPTQSDMICEVCHSQNLFHNYDVANNTGGTAHANQQDCMACHPHSQGFKGAGCDGCHGNPPITSDIDGSTNTGLVHTPSATGATDPASPGGHGVHANTLGMNCNTCHQGNTMPTVSNTIQMGVTINSSNWSAFGDSVTTATLNVPQDANLTNGYSYISSSAGTTVTKQNINNPNCTIYCHGDWAGNGGQTVTDWTGGAAMTDDCNDCHGGAAATPPTAGSHQTHAGNGAGDLALACDKCHPSYLDTTHLDGDVAWALDTTDSMIGALATYRGTASGTTGGKAPSAAYGNCSSTYCHGAGTPTWGGIVNCGDCHAVNNTLPGSHPTHYGQAASGDTASAAKVTGDTGTYVYQCGSCHDSVPHAEGNKDVAINLTWDTNGATGNWNSGTATCVSTYCHSDGAGGAGNVNPVWATTIMSCGSCHNAEPATGDHGKHVANATYNISCAECHNVTTTDGTTINDKDQHVDKGVDVDISATYDGNGATANWNGTSCAAVSCHSDGKATPTYDTVAAGSGPANCTFCHGGAGGSNGGAGNALSASHTVHTGTNGTTQFAYTCDDCHVQTASNNSTISSYANHVNKARDVAVAAVNGGAGTIGGDFSADRCATTDCHGSTTPTWTAGGTTGDCSLCHGMAANVTDGRDTNGDTAATDAQVGAHVVHLNNAVYDIGTVSCDDCHIDPNATAGSYMAKVNTAGHMNGTAGLTWSTLAQTGGMSPSYSVGACSNTYCHNPAASTVLNAANAGTTTSPSWTGGWDNADKDAPTCGVCHDAPPGTSSYDHSALTIASDCSGCHGHNGRGGTHLDGILDASGDCTSCHGGATPAAGVSVNSSHVYLTKADAATGPSAAVACEACHPGNTVGLMHAKDGNANVVLIPNNTSVGISYINGTNGYSGDNGIVLGGDNTVGITEAEICWECHSRAANNVSEWGQNNGSFGLSYNYGSLSNNVASSGGWYSNVNVGSEAGATWGSAVADFSYKQGAIKSTHSANTSGTAAVSGTAYSIGGMSEELDAVADIRCSYCHDVHNGTNGNGLTAGAPFIRGTWKGNPYKEDGAPRLSHAGSYTSQGGIYGPVPRGSASTTNNAGLGGYWIDQNSGNPNNGETLDSTAGLCKLCHSQGYSTDADIVNNMDYTASELLWVGTNGHGAAVIGGNGSFAANIFTYAGRGGTGTPSTNTSANTRNVQMGRAAETNRGYTYRGNGDGGYGYWPQLVGARPYAFQDYAWGANADNATAPTISAGTTALPFDTTSATPVANYHTFNCGKCHNPHASRLPKLMITNCLDTNHNTWQDHGSASVDAASGERASNWNTAQNCHRRGPAEAAGEGGSGTAWGAGWNKVTPW